VNGFFLPIFFTYTGLRTDVASLDAGVGWAVTGLVLLAAVAGKLLGCGLAARATGFSARESVLVGILMNTRGLMELVVANLGYALGVIPKSLFCTLVLLAVVTTVMTTSDKSVTRASVEEASQPSSLASSCAASPSGRRGG
jgi:Kef-type K+ transport system membrane component KefB